MIYPNGDIKYYKGDTETYRFNAYRMNGKEKVPCSIPVGHTYYFTVKRDKREECPIAFQKEVPIVDEKTYLDVIVSKEDVKDCCCGDYVYDLRCKDKDGRISTCLEPKLFQMCEVVGNNV